MFVSKGGGNRGQLGDEERDFRRRNTNVGQRIMLYEVTPSFASAASAVLAAEGQARLVFEKYEMGVSH
jgi:hypothetical protein